MFDDNNPRNSAPPPNLPIDNEPKDMFGDIDEEKNSQPNNALQAGKLKRREEVDLTEFPSVAGKEERVQVVKEPILGKVILIVLIGVLLAGIIMGGLWIYNNFLANRNKVIIVDETNKVVTTTVEEKTTPIVSEIPTNTNEGAIVDMQIDQVLFGEPIDSDKDGLDDQREKELGLDPRNSDTDNDGLIDGDEVLIWKTNPLNPDTDKDGYLDGIEVKNGYNPLGIGKLFSETQEASTSSTNTKK